MKTLKEIQTILAKSKNELREKFGVKEVGIFGSYVRGEEHEKSDIDILVEFLDGYKTFDNYKELKFYLEELLETCVDLISKTALKPRFASYILEDVIYV
ncbi:MAG: nucleotidyltransferase family protein [Chitinispirillaceae bacterium]|nr:nucleotidyltransferase family protein [Chitinispirillaceae bacterium]